MPITRRQYAGAAVSTTTTTILTSIGTSVSIASTTGWPSAAGVTFHVVLSPGTSLEEKCLATISGTTLTLTRAQDGTTAQTHSAGATIYPVFTSVDADEANKFASTMTTRGDLLTLNSSADPSRLALGAANRVLRSNGTDPSWGQVVAGDITDSTITAAKLNTSSAGTTGQVLIADTGVGGGLAWRNSGLLDSQTFTSSTTYTIPTSAQVIVVECIGAGGGGGGGSRASGATTYGASGGGGGPYERHVLNVAALGGVGASLTVTIGDGGTAGTGRTASDGNGTAGGAGGISRFGNFYFAGGRGGNQSTTSAAGAAVPGYVSPGHAAGTTAFGSSGAGSTTTGGAGSKGWRGGGGGGGGGTSGGAGGSFETSPAFSADNAWTASTGGGGAGGSAGGTGTAGGTSAGGGGGGNANSVAAGAGGAGGAAGGGGGGGGGGGFGNNGGNGGVGGRAEIKIWVYA